MFKSVFLALLALCLMTVTLAAQCGRAVIEQNWNSYPDSYRLYTKQDAIKDFGRSRDTRPSSDGKEYKPGLIFIKGHEGRGDRASVGEGNLRVKHPKGCVGTNECGVLFSVRLPEPLRSATLSYKVKFDEDYDFTRGGKLPGLCDEDCPTGCMAKSLDGGWSGRVHFREGGDLTSYMYLPGGQVTCGKDVYWGKKATPNKWTEIRLYYTMNTPGKNDGEQKVWMDGKLVHHTTGIIYDNTGTHGIDRLKFDNFHGGRSDRFRPSKTQYVWLDDLMVQEGLCPPAGARVELPQSEQVYYPDVAPPAAFQATPPATPPATAPATSSAAPPATLPVASTQGQCSLKFKSCRETLRCCDHSARCVEKDAHYAQCLPSNRPLPSLVDGWTGRILTPTDGAPAATPPATPLTTRLPPLQAPLSLPLHPDWQSHLLQPLQPPLLLPQQQLPPAAPPSSPPPANPAQCSLTFRPCGSGIGLCCNQSDQCVKKNEEYAQCRPKSRSIPDTWQGSIITGA